MKITFESLCVEITRKCNMKCAHCIRGEAQDSDMPLNVLEKLLERTKSIQTLIITGGEPSLNIEGMRVLLRLLKKRCIPIFGFYIVTNGKRVTDEFMQTLIDYHLYVKECSDGYEDDYSTEIALSQDIFHEQIPPENIYKLQTLAAFSIKDKSTDWRKTPLINKGRAIDLTEYPKREPYTPLPQYEIADGVVHFGEIVTLTVDGMLIADCDYSYDEISPENISNYPSFISKVEDIDKLR